MGKLHHHRTYSTEKPPVGFYPTVERILSKYNIRRFWNNIADTDHDQPKAILKEPIWLKHWKQDIEQALCYKSPFIAAFLRKVHPPKYPYKAHDLVKSLNPVTFPRVALSNVLRFWTSPVRQRRCSCGLETSNSVLHLLFECPMTRKLMSSYLTTLPRDVAVLLKPNRLDEFFGKLVVSPELLEHFNLQIGFFELPRY